MNVWPLPRITFRQLSTVREDRPVALVTDPADWANIRSLIELPLAIQAEPTRNDKDFLEQLGSTLPSDIGVIYAVGNDFTINIGKVIASQSKRPLVIIPTAFSSDVPFSWNATVTGDKGLEDVAAGAAEEVIINWSIITEANARERGAGIVDVMSALSDWRYAQQQNKTTPESRLVPWAMSVAAALAQQAIKSAPAIGQGSPEALRGLLDLICMSVQLDSQLGHRRATRGSEHIFANVVKADPGVSYAERVAAGILFASALHNQDAAPLRAALEAAGIPLGNLKAQDLKQAAKNAAEFSSVHNLPYTILNDQANADMSAVLARSSLLPPAAKTG
jgi:glycerol dehydrogenase